MFGAAVGGEVEDGFLVKDTGAQITLGDNRFVVPSLGLGDDLARGGDDGAAAHQVETVFVAGLGRTHHPGTAISGCDRIRRAQADALYGTCQ